MLTKTETRYWFRCDKCGACADTVGHNRDDALDHLEWKRRARSDLCGACSQQIAAGAKPCRTCGEVKKLLGAHCHQCMADKRTDRACQKKEALARYWDRMAAGNRKP
jgi:hypothetical protein